MAVGKKLIKAIDKFVINPPSGVKNGGLKILMVAAEAAPYATIGGFSSVVGYLSGSLAEMGHEVAIFMPKFGTIDEDKYNMQTVITDLEVPTFDDSVPNLICNVKMHRQKNGVVTYFLENQEYYEQRANVYGYSDDPTRWALLSRGTIEFVRKKIFVPDVIHCNDWHTGAVPNYLKTVYRKDPVLRDIATVFTIHNLAYQGVFDHRHVSELERDDGRSGIASFFDERLSTQNFMRRGILYADVVSTVSKTYSKEILTSEFGQGLDKLLMEVKEKVFGIINGLDYNELDPATDSFIKENYDINTLDLRIENKIALQKEFDLPVNPDIPVLGFVGRLDRMKGIDLIVNTLYHVLSDFDVQFVQVGGGDGDLAEMLQILKKDFPDRVGIYTHPNFTLPRLLFSGCDMILLPSRFEPCGIVQLEAMRYGAIPIVRKVGGLADTVENFDSVEAAGTGFVFKKFDEFSLFGQIIRALEVNKNKELWEKLQKNAMGVDYSWKYSAREYIRLYRIGLDFINKISTYRTHSHRSGNV